jgi:acyl-CoA synthetase (AMP-forming)/AMP-acid ligase II
MHPGVFAAKEPERPAVIMGTAGTVVTYAELEARSNQVAWLARRGGLRPGDGLAVIMENRPELLEAAWGAQRSGLQFTAVNWHCGPRWARSAVARCVSNSARPLDRTVRGKGGLRSNAWLGWVAIGGPYARAVRLRSPRLALR